MTDTPPEETVEPIAAPVPTSDVTTTSARGITERYNLRYPDGSQPPDGVKAFRELATDVMNALDGKASVDWVQWVVNTMNTKASLADRDWTNANVNNLAVRVQSVEQSNFQGQINTLSSGKVDKNNPGLLTGNLTVFGDIGAADIVGTRLRSTNPGSSSFAANVRMTAEGWLQQIGSSSRRYKTGVAAEFGQGNDPTQLLRVPVITFRYTDESDMPNGPHPWVGFLAEDIDEHYPVACEYDAQGRPESWNDRQIIPALLLLIQGLEARVDELESRLP